MDVISPTSIIEKSFELFKNYISKNIDYEEWHYQLCDLMDYLSKECTQEQSDYYLADSVLRMFLRGAVDIEKRRIDWQMADVIVRFKNKEYKTQIPVYDFGVFFYSNEKDDFWQMLIYNEMRRIFKEIYDRFVPMLSELK